jgi:hypothetical protein
MIAMVIRSQVCCDQVTSAGYHYGVEIRPKDWRKARITSFGAFDYIVTATLVHLIYLPLSN